MRMTNWTARTLTVTIAAGLAVGAGRGGAVAADMASGTEAEYCDAALAAESHPITGEESPAELDTFIQEYFDPQVALLPARFADDVAVLRAAIVGEPTDDYTEAIAADARIHDYSLAACEWPVQPVRMAEYAFEGVPESLPAGLISFEVTNEGDEAHAMVLLRRDDDVTLPFADLLDRPAEELLTLVDEIGGGVWLDPGAASYMVVSDLRAGDYALVCPIPVGADFLEEVSHDDGGPSHADEGMVHEFSIE